jgi:hypothetical protein
MPSVSIRAAEHPGDCPCVLDEPARNDAARPGVPQSTGTSELRDRGGDRVEEAVPRVGGRVRHATDPRVEPAASTG